MSAVLWKCDRCGAIVDASAPIEEGSDATRLGPEDDWAHLSNRGTGLAFDFCASCALDFAAFLAGSPVDEKGRNVNVDPPPRTGIPSA